MTTYIQKDWKCSSIENCQAIITIIGTLSYWQDKINKQDRTDDIKDVFSYLSSSNNYRDIISGYHHILDIHLNGEDDKEGWKYINNLIKKKGIKCIFKYCKGYDRNQRDRENEKKVENVAYFKIPADFEITGNFLGYIKFKRQLSLSQKMLNFDKESIKVVKGDTTGAIKVNGTLTIVGLADEFF